MLRRKSGAQQSLWFLFNVGQVSRTQYLPQERYDSGIGVMDQGEKGIAIQVAPDTRVAYLRDYPVRCAISPTGLSG